MKKIQGIYGIINRVTNDFLIGHSIDINNRLRGHFKALKLGKHWNPYLQAAYNKYGLQTFETRLIQEVRDKYNLECREDYWMDYYGTHSDYNIVEASGSRLGEVHSKQVKRKLSKSIKQLWKKWKNRGYGGGMLGRKHSEESRKKCGHIITKEQREKQSKLMKGRILSKEHKKALHKGSKEFWTGHHHTEESVEKIRQAAIQQFKDPKQRKKASKSHKGQKAWNKGLVGIQKAWNKGLTKETDERVMRYGKTRRERKLP